MYRVPLKYLQKALLLILINQNKIPGVNTDTLADYGAVSEQTAKEMAIGAVKASGSNVV